MAVNPEEALYYPEVKGPAGYGSHVSEPGGVRGLEAKLAGQAGHGYVLVLCQKLPLPSQPLEKKEDWTEEYVECKPPACEVVANLLKQKGEEPVTVRKPSVEDLVLDLIAQSPGEGFERAALQLEAAVSTPQQCELLLALVREAPSGIPESLRSATLTPHHKWALTEILHEVPYRGVFPMALSILSTPDLPMDEFALGCCIAVRYWQQYSPKDETVVRESLMRLAARAMEGADSVQSPIRFALVRESLGTLANYASVTDLPWFVKFLDSRVDRALQLRCLQTVGLLLSRDPALVTPGLLEPVQSRCLGWLKRIGNPDVLKHTECYSEAAAIVRAMSARLGPEMLATCRIVRNSRYRPLMESAKVIIGQAKEELERRGLANWVEQNVRTMTSAQDLLHVNAKPPAVRSGT